MVRPGPSGSRCAPRLTRPYKGDVIRETVRADGFDCVAAVHRSLGAVARELTGSPLNEYLFFRLTGGAR